MARKKSPTPIAISPESVDDLGLIKGIGPALSVRLQDAGITTYRQLASLTPDEIARQVGGLSIKQIDKQDWRGQAGKLASNKAKLKPLRKEMLRREPQQRYENFTLEFLLDEKDSVRRTRITHIQSGDADTWAGWEVKSFIDFLARHAGVCVPPVKRMDQAVSAERSRASQIPAVDADTKGVETTGPLMFPIVEPIHQTAKEPAAPAIQSPENGRLAGTLCLRSLEVIPTNSESPTSFLRQDQLYIVRLHLDLAEVVMPGNLPLIFKASILSKQLGGPSHAVGETVSTLNFSETIILDIDGTCLPPGAYRLEAFVELRLNESSTRLAANLKGNLLQVY